MAQIGVSELSWRSTLSSGSRLCRHHFWKPNMRKDEGGLMETPDYPIALGLVATRVSRNLRSPVHELS
jgi:hypothetical protein